MDTTQKQTPHSCSKHTPQHKGSHISIVVRSAVCAMCCCNMLQYRAAWCLTGSPPESRGVMEPDLFDVMLRGGARDDGNGVALGVAEMEGGVGMLETAFSKSST